jgi:hypothetical protein
MIQQTLISSYFLGKVSVQISRFQMSKNLNIKLLFLVLTIAVNSFCNAQENTKSKQHDVFPKDCWGVYSWPNFKPEVDTPENCPLIKGAPIILHWRNVEPESGVFKFDELLREKLELIDKNNYYTFLSMWYVPNVPEWVYNNGVPALKMTPTTNPFRKKRDWTYPYYLDKDYIFYYHRVIHEFGKYIQSLPEHLQKRILFVQSAEGTTGDGFWYKGEPVELKYSITHDQWGKFRQDAWGQYKSALSDNNGKMVVPLLVNYDSNREQEYKWLKENMDVVGLKNGMFSHGYHISHTTDRLANWNQYKDELSAQGKILFSRGEQDREWDICGWSKQNPEQAFYWSGIFATHCGISMWNIPGEAHVGTRFIEGLSFFNRHAGQFNPQTSTRAFCALRKGIDVSDTISYPENIYGKALQKNLDRYLKIVSAYSQFGAIQGDPIKALGDTTYIEFEGGAGATTSDGMMNRQRDDYNDAGWKILPGNYQRYIKQIAPEETSIGLWHVGPVESVYGRFARSTNAKMGNKLYFDVDDKCNFNGEIEIRIVWLDKGLAQWSLNYNATDGKEKEAFSNQNKNSGVWVEKIVAIKDAKLANGLQKNADVVIKNNSEDQDIIFHLIEIQKK